jgi:hypothetical protein
MRDDALYLTDIIEAADHIADFIANRDFDQFFGSELVRSAVVQKLAIMGEAAARITEKVTAQNGHVPWLASLSFAIYSSMLTSGRNGTSSGASPARNVQLSANK